jgi:protein tyrosine phosphatase (PTP) superfamily phosphohydrolase (DUF442 family)
VPLRRRLIFCSALAFVTASFSQPRALKAPNVVQIGPSLVTSGQPGREALSTLSALGFQAVIYLAPSAVSDAVKDEPELISKQGIEFVYIPIPFAKPEEHHFREVSAALTRLGGKKVLVHCQVNMRASSMVFLHRVITEKQDPAKAYDAVAAVWSPEGAWRSLLLTQLRKNSIAFEPY